MAVETPVIMLFLLVTFMKSSLAEILHTLGVGGVALTRREAGVAVWIRMRCQIWLTD